MSKKNKKTFVEAEKISRHLNCSICHEVFDDPMRTCCGHTFCYICIETWASLNKKCPICKTSLKSRKLQKDFIASLIIDDLKVKCDFQGCEWIGDHSILKNHMRKCTKKPKKDKIVGSEIQFITVLDIEQNSSCFIDTKNLQ